MTNFYTRWKGRLLAAAMLFVLCFGTTQAQWSELPALSDQVNFGINAIYDGKLYTWGGASSTEYLLGGRSLDILNGSSWTTGVVAPINEPKVGGYGGVVNGKIYLMGGSYNAVQNGQQVTVSAAQVYEYDPVSNTMTAKTPVPAWWFNGAGAVVNGKIYLMAGVTVANNSLVYNTTVRVYDPQTNTWATAGNGPYNAQYPTATAIGDTIYLIGGATNSGSVATAYKGVVSGGTITWTAIANYPVALQRAGAGVLGGKVYVAGGASSEELDAVYKYDPATNKWASDYALPVKTYNVGTMPSDGNSLYWIGGINNPKTFQFTPGAQVAIASVDQTSYVVTVNKGDNKAIRVPVTNRGVIDLTGSATGAMPWLTAPQPLTVAPGATANLVLNVNSSTLAVGKHQTTATLTTNDAKNKTITINVMVWVVENLKTQPFTAVIEEGGGSWCPPCFAGIQELESIKQQLGDRVLVLSYHGNQGGSSTNKDPMHFPEGINTIQKLGLAGFPNAAFQRRVFKGEQYPMIGLGSWADALNTLFAERDVAAAAIDIDESSYDASTQMVTAKVTVTTAEAIEMKAGRTLRLTGLVIQDGIVYHQAASQTRTWTFHDAVRSMGPTIDGTQLTVPSGMLVEGNILPPGSVLKGTVTFKVTNENDQGKLPGDENYPEITFDNNNKLPIKFEDCHLVVLAHMNDGNNYGEILQGVKAPFPTGGPTGAIISQTTSKWQATIKPSETASYTTTIKNLTDAPQELAVTRTQNNLPTGWSSYMKLGSTQLDPGTSSGNITLPPGASIAVQLYVTGTTEKSNGTVTLQFQAGATTLNQSYTTTTTESEPSSGVNDQPTTGVGMTLSANLPNPAATTTTFSYSLLQSGEVTVNVIGMNGEKVMTLNPGFAEAGLHTLRLDVSTLPAGSYIVTLSSNGRSASRSMTVVH